MNIMRIGRNVTIIAFLLSLLFHASTIIYIFMQKKAHSFANTIEQKEEELKNLQKKDGWVETKARASNFGAPVFFQDEPSFAKASSSAEATADMAPISRKHYNPKNSRGEGAISAEGAQLPWPRTASVKN